MICGSILDAVGHTPLVRLNRMATPDMAEVLVKFEAMNVGGSIKTRTAHNMIRVAEERGLLKPDSVIVEPTSGNQGIGLALIGAVKGYKTVIVMPDSVSEERRKLVKHYGAEAGAWAAQYRSDPRLQFWAEELLLVFLRQASAGLHEVLKKEVFGSRDYASLNPGSLKEWPVTGQRPLFALLGAGEDGVVPGLGVRLTRECLMLPAKSVSGLAFLSEAGFVNCAYCPRVSCPNRRAPYGGTSPLS